ncbi:MAG TPA: hypothetical protein V6D28_20690 [Leptolyngbyaceae cyanobacterium]
MFLEDQIPTTLISSTATEILPSPHIPKAILSVSREELNKIKLTVKKRADRRGGQIAK